MSESDSSSFGVLFVCTANICRSTYAELVTRSQVPAEVRVTSAGTHALVGRPMDEVMAGALAGRADHRDHQAQQVTRQLVEAADLVIAMSAEHRRYILDEWPKCAKKTFVIGQAARELAQAPDELSRSGIAEYLAGHRTSTPDDSVADPYGLGVEAARVSAAQIDALLAPIVQRLGGE